MMIMTEHGWRAIECSNTIKPSDNPFNEQSYRYAEWYKELTHQDKYAELAWQQVPSRNGIR